MARLRDYRLPKLQRPTPLHDAACFGNVAKALEALKDDPNIDVNDASLGANTPLQIAATYGHAEVAKLLLGHEVDMYI